MKHVYKIKWTKKYLQKKKEEKKHYCKTKINRSFLFLLDSKTNTSLFVFDFIKHLYYI